MTGEDFKAFFRQLASGVCVVTLWADERLHGFTATSLTSVCMSPAVALFCVDQGNDSFPYIREGVAIGASILDAGQRHLSDRFAEKAGPDGYASIETMRVVRGVPTLKGSLGQLIGTVSAIHRVGNHAVVLVDVREARAASGQMPIVYFDRSYHRLAPL